MTLTNFGGGAKVSQRHNSVVLLFVSQTNTATDQFSILHIDTAAFYFVDISICDRSADIVL